MSSGGVIGVSGEERDDYTTAESRQIRRRSRSLLASVLRPIRWRVALTVLLIALTAGAQTLGPALVAFGIDVGLPAVIEADDWSTIVLATIAFVLAAGVAALCVRWTYVLSGRLTQAVLSDLRSRLFRQSQVLSLDFHERYTSGKIISRQTNDVDSLQELLDEGLPQLIDGFLYMSFTIVALVLLDAPSAIIVLCAVIPMLALVRWYQVRAQRRFRAGSVTSARKTVKFVETMTGIRAVLAFRAEKQNNADFAARVEDDRQMKASVYGLFGVLMPGLTLIGNLCVAVALVYNGLRVIDGQLDIGVLLAVVLYVQRFFEPLLNLAVFYNAYQGAAAALEKISGILEEEPSVREPERVEVPTEHSGRVELDGVEFGYADGPVIIPRMDLRIDGGQTVALVGSTGAGKTTLAKLVARFYDPVRGEVRLDDTPLTRMADVTLRQRVVMITQDSYIFGGTIADNIELGRPGASRADIVAAATAVGAHEFISALPDGYDTAVSKRGGRLSAGERQQVSFARAFVADPEVLILDEATASLDLPSERTVQNALRVLLANRTAIIIAHRLSTVAIADRVLVMERGRVVEDGSPDELIAGAGRFAHLHAAWRDSLV